MPLFSFTIGEVFDANDPLDVWLATLAIAYNDLIHSNNKIEAAKSEWERLYEWRIATGHYNEMCLHLQRGLVVREVQRFLKAESAVKRLYVEALKRYESLRPLTNRVRNEAAFHYAYKKGQIAVARALRDLAAAQGAMGGTVSNKVKDSRQLYADDLAGQLVVHAAGGSLTTYAEAMKQLGEAVAVLGRFANLALEAHFVGHRSALKREPTSNKGRSSTRAGNRRSSTASRSGKRQRKR